MNSGEDRDANLFQSADDLFGSAEDFEDPFKSAHGAEDAADPVREVDANPVDDLFGGVVPGPHNQGMYFGTLPAALQPTVALLEAPVRAAWARCAGDNVDGPARTPLFDQAILNVYGPEGKIRAHVDLMRFEDGIAVVSLGSATTMTFAPAVVSSPPDAQPAADVNVVLCPGDVLLLTGASRYQWTHRIDAADADRWPDGSVRPRGTRVSLTFRRLTAAATLMTDDGV